MSAAVFVLVDAILLIGNHTISEYLHVAHRRLRAGLSNGTKMATFDDVARMASELPGATEGERHGNVSIRKSCERGRVCAGRRDPTHR